MHVEAIYDHGRLEFTCPLQLRHERLKLLVEVPDDEIVNLGNSYNQPQELLIQAREILAKLEAIRNAPLPPNEELPALTSKQLDRIEFIEQRAQIRAEQGRPD